MPRKDRSSMREAEGIGRWLSDGGPRRERPWAYELLLLGSSPGEGAKEEVSRLTDDVRTQGDDLARLASTLEEHETRIGSLEAQVESLPVTPPRPDPPIALTRFERRQAVVQDAGVRAVLMRRSYLLARCEGFQVDAPSGPIGFVEGVRFIPGPDRPDLLEVRGGRFGRRLVLIPVDEVEEVRVTEGRVVVRSAPGLAEDLVGELVHRFRSALGSDRAAS